MENTIKKEKSVRTRNWAFIMYPDSMPTNWKDTLEGFHVDIVVGPLHDKDINPTTNEPKKPHHHVIIIFDSVKTKAQAEEISKSVNGTNVVDIKSLNGAVRYLTHIDNPEKAQYDRSDIINIGAFDIDDCFKRSIDKYNTISEMLDYVESNNITEFFMFLKYCREEKFDTWFKALCDNSFIVREYITSKRNYLKEANLHYIEDDND